MNKITGLLRTSALCLTLAAMAACDAEDFTRTAGDIPGKDDLANVGGVLRREKTPDQISALKLGEEQTTTDAVFYQLTQPAAADVTVTALPSRIRSHRSCLRTLSSGISECFKRRRDS